MQCLTRSKYPNLPAWEAHVDVRRYPAETMSTFQEITFCSSPSPSATKKRMSNFTSHSRDAPAINTYQLLSHKSGKMGNIRSSYLVVYEEE